MGGYANRVSFKSFFFFFLLFMIKIGRHVYIVQIWRKTSVRGKSVNFEIY